MPELSVLVDQTDSTCRVRLRGDLDVSTAPRLRQDLEPTWGVAEFDCTQLEFVDSSGLAIWIERLKRDGAMVLINASPQVLRLLAICGLSEVFDLRTKHEFDADPSS